MRVVVSFLAHLLILSQCGYVETSVSNHCGKTVGTGQRFSLTKRFLHRLDLREGLWTGKETEVVLASHPVTKQNKHHILLLFEGFLHNMKSLQISPFCLFFSSSPSFPRVPISGTGAHLSAFRNRHCCITMG